MRVSFRSGERAWVDRIRVDAEIPEPEIARLLARTTSAYQSAVAEPDPTLKADLEWATIALLIPYVTDPCIPGWALTRETLSAELRPVLARSLAFGMRGVLAVYKHDRKLS